jgi:predicted MPP superfamily phosphohydrolase
MIKKIAHFADIHVPKALDRHNEYKKVLDKLYPILEEQKPDRIVIVGDTYDAYIDLEGEALILIGEILNRFSRIAPVIITRGNHEIRKKNRSRIDTVQTVTDLLQNPKVTYYNKSGFYQDDNVVWVVWDHVEHRYNSINPWKNIPHIRDKNLTYIDIYHDPIEGCVYHTGYNPGNRQFPSPSDFKGNFGFLGDIHLRQYFNFKEVEIEIDEEDLEKYLKEGWKIV